METETNTWRETVDTASTWLYEKTIEGIDTVTTLWGESPMLVSAIVAVAALVGLIMLLAGGKRSKQEDPQPTTQIREIRDFSAMYPDRETMERLHRIELKIDTLLERQEQDRMPRIRATRNGRGEEEETNARA